MSSATTVTTHAGFLASAADRPMVSTPPLRRGDPCAVGRVAGCGDPVLDLPAVPGASPLDFLDLVWRGAFGSWFSIQNTVQRASPLLLTALCVALPGQLGLVIIGGEAAVVSVASRQRSRRCRW